MACNIKIVDNRVYVTQDNGQSSELFDSINSNPLLTQEQALAVYKNVFSKSFEAEPNLSYRTAKGVFTSYTEALDSIQEGSIEMLMGDTAVASFNSNSNPDTVEGLLNKHLRLGNITEQKFGEFLVASDEIRAQDFIDDAAQYNIEVLSGDKIKIEPNDTFNKERFLERVKKGEIKALEREMGEQMVAKRLFAIYMETNGIFPKSSRQVAQNLPTESQLVNTLTNFLNKIGVSVTSIESYKQMFNAKQGIDPSAKALADIANQVVAFAEGQLNEENIAEETAHFAVEAFQDQELLGRLLANVHFSNEWKSDAARYLEVYGKQYEGAELDNVVRREILGKILARKIRERFADTQDTPVESGFSNILRNLWNTLLERVKGLFTNSAQKELDSVTDSIANAVLKNEYDTLFSESQIKKSDYIFYALDEKTRTSKLQRFINALKVANKTLSESRLAGTLDSVQRLIDNNKQLSNAESWQAINNINNSLTSPIAKAQYEVTEALEKLNNGDPNNNELYLSDNVLSAITSLEDSRKILQEIITTIEKGQIEPIDQASPESLIKDLKSKVESIDSLIRDRDYLSENGTQPLIEKMMAKWNVGEKFRKYFEREAIDAQKDITLATRWFGQLQYADHALLQLIGIRLKEMHNIAGMNTQKDLSAVYDYVDRNGNDPKQLDNILEKKDDGTISGYLKSKVLRWKYDADRKAKIEELLNGKTYNELSPEELATYNEGLRQWEDENTEKPFTQAYYEARRKATEFMSQETKEFLKQLSTERARIRKKYKKGEVYSTADRLHLEDLARQRKQAKSLYNLDTTEKQPGTSAYQIAQDLRRADEEFQGSERENLQQDFVDILTSFENYQDAINFVDSNGGTRFTSEFYDAISEGGSTIERLREQEENELADSLEAATKKRSEILRMFQKASNPAEIDATLLTLEAKLELQRLDVQIEDLSRQANKLIEPKERTIESENEINEAYIQDFLNEGNKRSEIGSEKELAFTKKHLSDKNRKSVDDYSALIDNLLNNRTDFVPIKFRRFISTHYNIDSELSDDVFYENFMDVLSVVNPNTAVLAFARSKVYSYYKRFAPKGYSELKEAIRRGVVDISQLLTNREALIEDYPAAKYLEITPNYMWYENSTTAEINENYDTEGAFVQPKVSKYANPEYNSLSEKDKELIKVFQDLKRKAADNYGIAQGVDVNKIAQISKSNIQKAASAIQTGIGKTFKNALKDLAMTRVDTLEQGVQEGGNYQIPVKYIYDLEDVSDLSTDLYLTYAELVHESNLYKERKKAVKEVEALKNQIKAQNFKNRSGENSNAYQMAEDFIKRNVYGVYLTRKLEVSLFGRTINIAKIATSFRNLLVQGSLTFNPTVAATNYLSSLVQSNVLESTLGQFMNQISNVYSYKEFTTKELPSLLTDSGNLNKTSKIYKLLEQSNMIDIRKRFQNQNLGKMANLFSNAGWRLIEAGDISAKGRVFISVFDDMRLVDGRFMTFNEFKLNSEGLTKKAAESKWGEYRKDSLWNILDNQGTNPLGFKQEYVDKVGEQYLSDVLNKTTTRAANIAARIDGQVSPSEKSAASADFILGFTTGMRSWLFSALQYRLQGKKFDLSTGQEIEGSYITSGRMVQNIIKKMRDDRGIMNLLTIIKNEWSTADDFEKYNIQRVVGDITIAMTLIGLATLAFAGSDDDDDALYAFGTYLLYRTANESYSVTPLGLAKSIEDVIDKPVAAVSFLKQATNSSWFEDSTGKYEGVPKIAALLIKQTPAKLYWDYSNIQQTSDTYRRLSTTLLYLSSDKKTEEVIDYFNLQDNK